MKILDKPEPSTPSAIVPYADQRAVIIGLAGSGKSNLAKMLTMSVPQKSLVVIDPKNEWDTRGFKVITESKRFPKPGKEPLIFQPTRKEFDDVDAYEHIFSILFETKNLTCYVDEVSVFCSAYRYPAAYKACYHQGRTLHIRTISTTQRPSAVPPFIMSEAIRFYAFYLTLPADKQKVRGMVPGYDPDALKRFEFFYYDILADTQRAKIMKLSGAYK